MKMPYPGFMTISRPSNMKRSACTLYASWMVSTCCAMTLSTSMSMRLNSSKHAHAPDWATPEKNWLIVLAVKSGPQFMTTHWRASALARSLVVSVLPVPAGPAGAPPMPKFRPPVSVM